MPSQRPEGYFFARHDDGALCVEENGPGLGAVRISWRPTGNFDADRRVEFRLPLEVWNAIIAQKNHETLKLKARTEKVKA